ncbi:mannose-1-phosphate guanylyltransferase/mannose-6-phosphate isomerase [Maridesulfovibrio frigidus]|uniref:mannose-1-phosphate guanylyltransferase/mannose-6-phosphate isomerase n=1 Tax=Maridesulfovibrio frigidus TaxID=340956 RepID=UPI0004E1FE1E|nr:mannose-1-phosphate guanylyltransferase/mannose-6-phosphate isomerase [Maridesulfovibrio frigidus]
MIIPVILSGGSGTRLWPLSRKLHPKQLLDFMGDGSLLQTTVRRGCSLAESGAPIVVCNECYRFMVAEQLRQIDVSPDAILLEPEGRNSAPAIAVAAFRVQEKNPDGLMLVMPSDHIFQNSEAFYEAVQRGVESANKGDFVLFGIVPTSPETGYGYIRHGDYFPGQGVCPVNEFVEKPDFKTAQSYLDSGEYFWNGGVFLFKASVYLNTLKELEPAIYDACRDSVEKAQSDLDFIRLHEESFLSCPSKSVDYAVMEQVENRVVVPLDSGWSDIGSWDSLMRELPDDANGNVIIGDVLDEGVTNSFMHSSGRVIGVVGVDNMVVVETKDAVLVADRSCTQDVKILVERLSKAGRDEASVHRQVFRPWGSYELVDSSARFQVKRIIVKPGGILSLQMHHHRAEHWVVVSGTASVLIGGEEVLLREDQSTYIPIGVKHRLTNPGKIDLELIEVQTGSYLGEDDISRFEDAYGRSGDSQKS